MDSSNRTIDKRLTKDKKSGLYNVRFKGADGKARTRSTKAGTLQEARQVVRDSKILDLEIAAKAGALQGEAITAIVAGKKVTCSDALAEWKHWASMGSAASTVSSQEGILLRWFNDLGANRWPVSKLTLEHIDASINVDDPNLKESSRLSRLWAIRSYIKFLTAKGYRNDDPSAIARVNHRMLSHEQKEQRPIVLFTEAQINKLLSDTQGFWHYAIALGYYAGLRISDVANLEWASISEDHLIVHTGKGNSRVAVPIDDPLMGGGKLRMTFLAITTEHVSKSKKYCFPEEQEIMTDPKRRSRLSVYFGRLLEAHNIEGPTFHCLRHGFATRLKKAGKTIEDIGELMGHASLANTKLYIHK